MMSFTGMCFESLSNSLFERTLDVFTVTLRGLCSLQKPSVQFSNIFMFFNDTIFIVTFILFCAEGSH